MNGNKNELEFNRRNRETTEQLMDDASTKLDGYYDKNNVFVRLLLLVLFVIIAVGSFIVLSMYFGSYQ